MAVISPLLLIKRLHRTGATLRQEVEMMCKGSSPFVIQVLGVFQGKLPSSGPSMHLGLVMEFMERGSLASLQVHGKHIQKMYHSFNRIE